MPQISDDEARRLWQRAVELQAEAESAAASTSVATASDSARLSLEHVTQAAEGAGITGTFVLLAMAEQQLPDAEEIRRDRSRARVLRAVVSKHDAIEVTRFIRGSPDAVLGTLKRVAIQPAFNMLLENTVATPGDVRDRVVVLRLQGGSSPFSTTLNWADVRVLLVTLRPAHDGTHVHVRAPLFRRGTNLSIAGVATILGGSAGSWSGSALAAWAAGAIGVAAGSALLIPAGLATVGGGVLGLAGFRAMYRHLARQGQGAITSFLNALAMEVEAAAPASVAVAPASNDGTP